VNAAIHKYVNEYPGAYGTAEYQNGLDQVYNFSGEKVITEFYANIDAIAARYNIDRDQIFGNMFGGQATSNPQYEACVADSAKAIYDEAISVLNRTNQVYWDAWNYQPA